MQAGQGKLDRRSAHGVYGVSQLELAVVSLRYSSWSIRAWLALTHAGASFETRTAELDLARQQATVGVMHSEVTDRSERRSLGSVTGLFPVLWIDQEPVHEALAICEWTAEQYPEAALWPDDALLRAQARSLACEMASDFSNLRAKMYCHVFARVPGFHPDPDTRQEIERVFEIWTTCLERSGGPFLFERFGIVDSMYFPVLTRFATYGVQLPRHLRAYAEAMHTSAPVLAWRELARKAPTIDAYDSYIMELGGDLNAAF
jgi:glutathione S-transferase